MPISTIRTWRQTVRDLPATHPLNLRIGEVAHLAPLAMVAGFTSLLFLAYIGGHFLRWTQNAHADFGLATGMGWDWIHINTSWLAHADAEHLTTNVFALALAGMGMMALSMTSPPAAYPAKEQIWHMLVDLSRCLLSMAVVLMPIVWTCGLLDAYLYPRGSSLVGSSGVITGFFGLMTVDLCLRRRMTDVRWIAAALLVAAFAGNSLLADAYLVAQGFPAVDHTSHLGHVFGCGAGMLVGVAHWTASRWLPARLQRGHLVLSDRRFVSRLPSCNPDSVSA